MSPFEIPDATPRPVLASPRGRAAAVPGEAPAGVAPPDAALLRATARLQEPSKTAEAAPDAGLEVAESEFDLAFAAVVLAGRPPPAPEAVAPGLDMARRSSAETAWPAAAFPPVVLPGAGPSEASPLGREPVAWRGATPAPGSVEPILRSVGIVAPAPAAAGVVASGSPTAPPVVADAPAVAPAAVPLETAPPGSPAREAMPRRGEPIAPLLPSAPDRGVAPAVAAEITRASATPPVNAPALSPPQEAPAEPSPRADALEVREHRPAPAMATPSVQSSVPAAAAAVQVAAAAAPREAAPPLRDRLADPARTDRGDPTPMRLTEATSTISAPEPARPQSMSGPALAPPLPTASAAGDGRSGRGFETLSLGRRDGGALDPTGGPRGGEAGVGPATVTAASSSASTGGGGPTTAAVPAAAQTVADHAARLARRDSPGEVEIRLDPPELGRVRLSLTRHDHALVVSIVADRPEVADLLRRHADVLGQSLADAGHAQVDLQFGPGGEERDGGAGRFAPGGDLAADEGPPPPAARVAGARGLDLRV